MNSSLQQLKDIHLPAPEAWWHLAWGWWFVLCFVAVLVLAIRLALPDIKNWFKYRNAMKAIQSDVQDELKKMRASYEENHDGLALLRSISIFLRRVSLTQFEGSESAGLIEDAWLDFLDKQWGNDAPKERFSDAMNADLLKYVSYKDEIDENMQFDVERLLVLAEKWSLKVLNNHG